MDETAASAPNLKELKIETQELGLNERNSLVVNLNLPAGYHLNTDAPNRFELTPEDGKSLIFSNAKSKFKSLPVTIDFQTKQTGATWLKAQFTFYYCREDNTGECRIKTLAWTIPVKISESGKNSISISAVVE